MTKKLLLLALAAMTLPTASQPCRPPTTPRWRMRSTPTCRS